MNKKNINHNIKKLLEITMNQCINENPINRIDQIVEEVAFDIFLDGILEQQSEAKKDISKIELYLNHALIRIVPSVEWKKFIEKTTHTNESIQDALYISLKRHFYINTINEFPTN